MKYIIIQCRSRPIWVRFGTSTTHAASPGIHRSPSRGCVFAGDTEAVWAVFDPEPLTSPDTNGDADTSRPPGHE